MLEHAKANIGTVKRQAEMINSEIEEKLKETGMLGEKNPDQLHNTLLFMIGLNIGLRAGEEHYELRRELPGKASQLQFKCNDKGVRYLIYEEDTSTKTNDGGIKSMRNK